MMNCYFRDQIRKKGVPKWLKQEDGSGKDSSQCLFDEWYLILFVDVHAIELK